MASNSQGTFWTSADSNSSSTVVLYSLTPKLRDFCSSRCPGSASSKAEFTVKGSRAHLCVHRQQMESRDLPAPTWMDRSCANMTSVGCPVLLLSSCWTGLESASDVYLCTCTHIYTHNLQLLTLATQSTQ